MITVNITTISLPASIFLISMRSQVGHRTPSLPPSAHPFPLRVDFVNSIDLDDVDLEQWISQSSFPSPPMDSSASPLSPIEETTSTPSEYADMVVPPSPPLSSAGSSPAPTTTASRKPKLSTVERKLRKKTQNKTAAEKYRIKKKSERHTLLDRHTQLKSVNRDLKLELENLAFRVEKFKQLFVDLLQIDPSTGN